MTQHSASPPPVAILTGAGSGIGRAAALALAARGWNLVLAGRRAEPTMDVTAVGEAVAYMAGLPLAANVQFMTVMATAMPFIGRG